MSKMFRSPWSGHLNLNFPPVPHQHQGVDLTSQADGAPQPAPTSEAVHAPPPAEVEHAPTAEAVDAPQTAEAEHAPTAEAFDAPCTPSSTSPKSNGC